MLNFHQIVLRKFILLFSLLLLIVGSIVYYWTKEFYISQTRDSLLNNLEIISFNIKNNKIETLAKNVKSSLNIRLTVIDYDGAVLAESHKNKEQMDNHKDRDEILQASTESYGYKIRYSSSINKNLLYIAKKYPYKSSYIYIRLAKELKSIDEQIFSLGVKILIVLSLFFMIVFFITYKVSKEVEKEIQNIVNFLSSLTRKQKSTYINSVFSIEFSHITKLLTKVSQILTKKEKQKAKYTAKLQTSNEQKDDIISAISHEFKNPIAVINGYSQTLLEDDNIDPLIRKKFLTKIHSNGEKMSALIDTLRLSIQLQSNQSNLNLISINLHNAIHETVENLQATYPKRTTRIEGDNSIVVKADSLLLGVILSNLIENAFKYSQDKVLIKYDKSSLSVIDTGIGISQENLKNITNKFYRIHENSWNNSLGLGLFLVKNIVKLHSFSLSVKSIENKGSTFSIIFKEQA